VEWTNFLRDLTIDPNLGEQPPEKYLFGKMTHDVLECLNAIIGWIRLVEEMSLVPQVPMLTYHWLTQTKPLLQQEIGYVYTLLEDYSDQSRPLDAWLSLIDEMGTIALRVVGQRNGFDKLPDAPQAHELIQTMMKVIKYNFIKLELIGNDIRLREYKRLWTLRYDDLIGMR
jgi:hypothetical protein